MSCATSRSPASPSCCGGSRRSTSSSSRASRPTPIRRSRCTAPQRQAVPLPELANVRAIATDCPVPDAPVPVLPLDDIGPSPTRRWRSEPLAGVSRAGRARRRGRCRRAAGALTGAADARRPDRSAAMAQLSNDCFAFGGELMTVDEAMALIAERLAGRRRRDVPLIEADGRVLGAGHRRADRPAALRQLRRRRLRGALRRPRRERRDRAPGASGRIAAGARSAVACAEARRGADLHRRADAGRARHGLHAGGRRRRPADASSCRPGLKRGANRRLAGEDIARGATALAAGRRLAPQDIALLAALGLAAVPVRTPLRVAVFSTGDEVVSPGEPLGAGKALRRQPLHAAGAAAPPRLPRDRSRHPRRRAARGRRALAGARRRSRSDRHLRRRLDRRGGPRQGGGRGRRRAHLLAHRHQAGRPVAMGVVAGTPFIGLPGNPVAVFVTFAHVARAVIARLSGERYAPPRASRCWRASPTARRRAGGNMCASASSRDGRARRAKAPARGRGRDHVADRDRRSRRAAGGGDPGRARRGAAASCPTTCCAEASARRSSPCRRGCSRGRRPERPRRRSL